MNAPLLSLRLRRKRDVVLARQRARHLAALVGLGPRDQAALACGVFETAWRALQEFGRVKVEFALGDAAVRVSVLPHAGKSPEGDETPQAGKPTCLERALPERLPAGREDLAWSFRQAAALAPLDCYEEMRLQNLELLQALADLHRAESAVTTRPTVTETTAA
jgi:hypothetical protein